MREPNEKTFLERMLYNADIWGIHLWQTGASAKFDWTVKGVIVGGLLGLLPFLEWPLDVVGTGICLAGWALFVFSIWSIIRRGDRTKKEENRVRSSMGDLAP